MTRQLNLVSEVGLLLLQKGYKKVTLITVLFEA